MRGHSLEMLWRCWESDAGADDPGHLAQLHPGYTNVTSHLSHLMYLCAPPANTLYNLQA